MKHFLRHLLTCVLLLAGVAARGQIVVYGFGSTASPTTGATGVSPNLTASMFSGNAGSPVTGGSSPLFTAGSGGGYFTASAWTGAAPGTNYFEFTLTPTAGYGLSITSLTLGYRASTTGPTSFAVRSSADAYASSFITGSLTNDSAWHSTGTLSLTLSGLNTPTTFRLYAAGASSAAGTLRVDDVTVRGSVTAVPEPATWAGLLGLAALLGAMLNRRKGRAIDAAP